MQRRQQRTVARYSRPPCRYSLSSFLYIRPELKSRLRVIMQWFLYRAIGEQGVENLLVILVVEDDQLIQSLVEETLTDGGFEIVIASSGENAVVLLDASEGKFRALVTDETRSTAGVLPDTPEKSTLTFPSSTRAAKTRAIGRPRASRTASCWRSRSRPLNLSLPFLSFSTLHNRQRSGAAV